MTALPSPRDKSPPALLQRELESIRPADPDAAVDLAELLISKALHYRASDIHIHPLADGAWVRLRIDGRLHPAARVPPPLADPLVTRLKVMAKLVVYQRSLPQDGRIEWTPRGNQKPAAPRPVPLRVAFLPTLHGEDVVIRLPETSAGGIDLADLGMDEATLGRARELLSLEQGTLLLTGPGGSGKTTTIYAFLRALHARRGHSAHILTLEDPIEQDLEFAGQVPIRPDQGLDWSTALRSVLRHDPNVILIGEIRDRETAEIAVHAGLTGHLVISTVHSGRAVGVLVRLLHMNIEPFLVASSVTCVLAQRLAPRMCPECRKPAAPSVALARRLALPVGTTLWSATGCDACGGTGGRGRTGLFELLLADAPLREAVMNRSTEADLQRLAFPQGDALLADALAKARAGTLAIEELERFVAASPLSEE